MNVCIKCNPVSLLRTDEAGELFCIVHDKQFVLEAQPDPVPPAQPEPEPA